MRYNHPVFFFLLVAAVGLQCRCATQKAGTNGPSNMPPTSNLPGAPTIKSPSMDKGVAVRVTAIFTDAKRVSFGVPLPRGVVKDAGNVVVKIGGKKVAAEVTETLPDVDMKGARVGARALRVQLDPALLDPKGTDLELAWTGGDKPAIEPTPVRFDSEDISGDSPSIATTVQRTIKKDGGAYALAESNKQDKTVFLGREPRLVAIFPPGYIAATGILGSVMTAGDAAAKPELAGLGFLSTAATDFLRSAMYDEPYAINPDPDSLPDFAATYEAWLYDRCSTFLLAYVHGGDVKFLRHALRTCSYYASKIELSGSNRGIFTGKTDPDPKYSHARGLYAYYALTADERAFDAMKAIGDLWLNDKTFVGPYREGHIRGIDKLWTERLLGVSLEGLLYAHRLAAEQPYLDAFKEMLATAYLHITGDQAALDTINPGAGFPPQNCFVHSAEQHSEGGPDAPWCSSWMSELAIDVLLQYAEHTNDPRVPEIFVRLGRFVRDVGTNYFKGNPLGDSFLQPKACFTAGEEDPRILVPLYGSGIGRDGKRVLEGEYEDFEHCTDASALIAAARWGLEKGVAQGQAPAPFATEKESFEALHQELLFCADTTFKSETRPKRDPGKWTSQELAAGAGDPGKFITDNKIGYPQHQIAPLRKIGWWFNMSMLQFGVLQSVNLTMPQVKPGRIQPAGCK